MIERIIFRPDDANPDSRAVFRYLDKQHGFAPETISRAVYNVQSRSLIVWHVDGRTRKVFEFFQHPPFVSLGFGPCGHALEDRTPLGCIACDAGRPTLNSTWAE